MLIWKRERENVQSACPQTGFSRDAGRCFNWVPVRSRRAIEQAQRRGGINDQNSIAGGIDCSAGDRPASAAGVSSSGTGGSQAAGPDREQGGISRSLAQEIRATGVDRPVERSEGQTLFAAHRV